MSEPKAVAAGPALWPEVVASIGPKYDGSLQFFATLPERLASSRPPQYAGGRLAGCGIAAAALAVLRGPSAASAVLGLGLPGVPRAAEELPRVLDKNALLPALLTLSFVNVARCCGLTIPAQAIDLEPHWLPQLARHVGQLTEPDCHTLALAADAARLPALAGTFTQATAPQTAFAPGQTQGFNVPAFAGYIAAAIDHGAGYQDVEPAWLDFVHRFPYKLDTRMLGWPDLLWAARAVYTTVGGLPEGEVAMELHRLVTGA